MDDILWNVLLLLWFLIAGVAIYVTFGDPEPRAKGAGILATLHFLLVLALILNNYFGNEVIEGTVCAVNKTGSDETVKTELSESIKTEIEPSREILKSYEVAIYPSGSKAVRILKNHNSLWRFKFNKREIQLQIQPGKKYSFHVYRLLSRSNILRVREE